jgi:hypothetical protein
MTVNLLALDVVFLYKREELVSMNPKFLDCFFGGKVVVGMDISVLVRIYTRNDSMDLFIGAFTVA